jgi:hypothetical protein
MVEQDRTVVAAFVLVLLGLSYLIAVGTFAAAFLLPAGVAYALVAAALLWRVSR